jgi:hypothetical protein
MRFIATGDILQLKAIDKHELLRSNIECVDVIFPTKLQLDVIKRVKNESDREGYKKIHRMLFDEHLPITKNN